MDNRPFCAWPWFHQRVAPNGAMSPCCAWAGEKTKLDHKSFFHSEFMNNIRQSFADGKPHSNACDQCLYHEKVGKHSQRMASFDIAERLNVNYLAPVRLQSQEVNLSNLCNLKCRTCSPNRSTKWMSDADAVGYDNQGYVESNWELGDSVDDMQMIMLLGGEPLLHEAEIIANLEKIEQRGRLNEISIYFTTNCTVKLSDRLIELLSKTKLASFLCSIDAYGPLNDYIRSDSVWEEIENNIKNLCDLRFRYKNFKMKINSVISVFNAEHYDRLLQWGIDMNIECACSPCSWPKIHDARNLPTDYKKQIIEKYLRFRETIPNDRRHIIDSVIKHLRNDNLIQEPTWKELFQKHNIALDDRRSVRLQDYNSALFASVA